MFVQPRAAKDAIVGLHGNAVKLKLRAPPVDDRANRSLCEVLGRLFSLPPSEVVLLTGASSRNKKVFVPLPPDRVAEVLEGYVAPH